MSDMTAKETAWAPRQLPLLGASPLGREAAGQPMFILLMLRELGLSLALMEVFRER
jgi:hypothetical protein